MSRNLRMVDARVRQAMRGTERIRVVVDSVHSPSLATVRFGGALLPAIVPALPVTLVAGMVAECERPRGVGGQLQITRVLGASGPTETAAAITAAKGTTTIVTELPDPSVAYLGTTLLLDGGAGVASAYWRCDKSALDVYAWVDVT